MNFFRNLPIAKKLSCLIVVAALALAAVGFSGYFFLKKADDATDHIYSDGLLPIKAINENRGHQRGVQASLLEMMLTTDMTEKNRLLDDIKRRADVYTKNVQFLEKGHLDATEKKSLDDINTLIGRYRASRDEVIQLAMQNKNAEAYQFYVGKVRPLADGLNDSWIKLADYKDKASAGLKERVDKDLDKAFAILAGVSIAALVLLILIGLATVRAIATPLKQVASTVSEVAAGNLAVSRLNIDSRDEAGQVATSINTMTENLRSLIKQVADSAQQVAASSEQLNASAEQSAQVSDQIAQSVTGVATGAESQLKAAETSSAAVQQMSASIQQAAASANTVADTSAKAAGAADQGGKQVDTAVSQMVSIEKTVVDSAAVVQALGERSKEIGQIVDTISGIAAQTNLLALNAAIEAARAGEAGRGFAVVAEEVRKLAEQSQEASKQIGELIGSIQTDTEKAVAAMHQGTQEAKRGTEVVTTAGAAFQQIAALVTEVSGQAREISAAMQQMAGGSQQMVASIREIDDASRKAAAESQTVSAATEEQSATMQEIAASSQGLSKLAQDMQAAVLRFRVA